MSEGCSGVKVTVTVSVGAGVEVKDGQGVIEVIPVGEGVFVSAIVGDKVAKLCVAVGPAVGVSDGLASEVKLGLGLGFGVSVGVGSTMEEAVAVGVSCIVEIAVKEGVSWSVGDRVNVLVNPGVDVWLLVTARVGVADAEGVFVGVQVGDPGLTFPGEGSSETSQSFSESVSTLMGYLTSELPSGAAETGG